MSAHLTTPDPPARYPSMLGATWTRERNPKGVVTVNGEEMPSVFAVNEQAGLAAALVITEDGEYRLESPGRYMIRRIHGIVRVTNPK